MKKVILILVLLLICLMIFGCDLGTDWDEIYRKADEYLKTLQPHYRFCIRSEF